MSAVKTTSSKVFYGLQNKSKAVRVGSFYPHKGAMELHVCDNCFEPFAAKKDLKHHMRVSCGGIPGRVVYEDVYGNKRYKFYEVDGARDGEFSKRLCLFAKFWAKDKIECNEMENFNFYLLTSAEKDGEVIVGYFSKSKQLFSTPYHNLAVIVVFPFYQKNGYGYFLVDLSNKLSVLKGKPGTPEGPLSDKGKKLFEK